MFVKCMIHTSISVLQPSLRNCRGFQSGQQGTYTSAREDADSSVRFTFRRLWLNVLRMFTHRSLTERAGNSKWLYLPSKLPEVQLTVVQVKWHSQITPASKIY